MIYSTFIGGIAADWGQDIAIDEAGNAYVTGHTSSFNFPTTPGAFDTAYDGDGDYDVFVVKLDAFGSSLHYSTYLAGPNDGYSDDEGYGIAVDGEGNAFITGSTDSVNFPTTPGAFDTTYNGGPNDAFVAKLNATGSDLLYSTYLGGEISETGLGITLDGVGNAFIIGTGNSSGFPITPGAFDTTPEWHDIFVAKLSATGSSLLYSTFIGGEFDDYGSDIVVDQSGHVFVTGHTRSPDFPVTPGAFDTTTDYHDAFVTRLVMGGSVTAGFTANSTIGSLPLTVTFTNLSIGDYGVCLWDFGDGNSSNECDNPAHTYTTPGIFTVSLSVSGPGDADMFVKESYIFTTAGELYQLFLPTTPGADS